MKLPKRVLRTHTHPRTRTHTHTYMHTQLHIVKVFGSVFALFSVAVAKLLKSASKSLTERCQKRGAGGEGREGERHRKGEKVRVRVRRERERAEGSERVSAAHNSQALLVAVVVRP